jgi:hypothetical protein
LPARVLDGAAGRAALAVEAEVLALLALHHRKSREGPDRLRLDEPPELEELPVVPERPPRCHLGRHAAGPVPVPHVYGRLEEERVGPRAVAHEQDPVARLRFLEARDQGQQRGSDPGVSDLREQRDLRQHTLA